LKAGGQYCKLILLFTLPYVVPIRKRGQYCKLILLLFSLPYVVSIGKDASNVKVCRYSQVSNDFEEIPT
jgi:hypothetical protein